MSQYYVNSDMISGVPYNMSECPQSIVKVDEPRACIGLTNDIQNFCDKDPLCVGYNSTNNPAWFDPAFSYPVKAGPDLQVNTWKFMRKDMKNNIQRSSSFCFDIS